MVLFPLMIMSSCKNEQVTKKETMVTEEFANKCGAINFTQSINLSNGSLTMYEDSIKLTAGANTDLFCDPKGVSTITSSPLLLSKVDNTKPFTFTVKVKPDFTPDGTYSAGVILVFANETKWQKLCVEQDEAGVHRIVTVRTVGTSDDNNHEAVDSASVYLRLSSDTDVIGSYYSLDGIHWHLARIYKNDYPAELSLAISSQSPRDTAHTCVFSELDYTNEIVTDFREGAL